MGLSFFLWAQTCFSQKQFALCGKTISSLRRNLLQDLIPFLQKSGMQIRETRSENLLTVQLGSHVNRFLLFGGHDESSASLIQGSTLAGVLLDEVALMPRSFVEQACARCSIPNSLLWFNCNPEGPQHWFYQEWILKARQHHALYLHFTMDDNPSLTPHIRARYRNAYSGIFYQRFVLGEWTAAQGLVYDFFRRDRDALPPPPPPFDAWRVSIDYGTVNPASFGLWGRKNNTWFRVREFYYNSRKTGYQKTDAEYAQDLLQLIDGLPIERIIIDPSAASFIEVLRRKNLPVIRANNQVSDGIRITADFLKSHQIILCQSCPDCLREIELYCWDPKGHQDAPRKIHDHAMDDLRYFAMNLFEEQLNSSFAAVCVERSI